MLLTRAAAAATICAGIFATAATGLGVIFVRVGLVYVVIVVVVCGCCIDSGV